MRHAQSNAEPRESQVEYRAMDRQWPLFSLHFTLTYADSRGEKTRRKKIEGEKRGGKKEFETPPRCQKREKKHGGSAWMGQEKKVNSGTNGERNREGIRTWNGEAGDDEDIDYFANAQIAKVYFILMVHFEVEKPGHNKLGASLSHHGIWVRMYRERSLIKSEGPCSNLKEHPGEMWEMRKNKQISMRRRCKGVIREWKGRSRDPLPEIGQTYEIIGIFALSGRCHKK